MKTLLLLKNRTMSFDISTLCIITLSVIVGGVSFMYPPVILLDISSTFQQVVAFLWSVVVAGVLAWIAAVAKEFGTRFWNDKGSPLYDKFFNKNKSPKRKRRKS